MNVKAFYHDVMIIQSPAILKTIVMVSSPNER